MYEEFFKLSGAPFKLNPDPKFFFGSASHNKAMSYLHYGLRQAEGFIVVTGEIGAGKSILIGHLIDQLDRSSVVAAHLLTPNLQPDALLSHILSAFRIEPAGDGKTAELEAFEDFLFDQLNHGRRVLLIVDEAQSLPVKTLEELRILSNMDYDGTPLFQVFLIGQPDFRPVIAAPDMEQLRQRIIASYHLKPLTLEETNEYIEHRLSVVGWDEDPIFQEDALARIFEATDGLPRKINKLCNRVLLYCSLEEIHRVDGEAILAVLADMNAEDGLDARSDEAMPAKSKRAAVALPKAKPVKTKAARKAVKKAAPEPQKEKAAALKADAAEIVTPAKQGENVVPFKAAKKTVAKKPGPKKAAKKSTKKVQDKEENAQAADNARAPEAGAKTVENMDNKDKPGKTQGEPAVAPPPGAVASAPSAGAATESVLDRLKKQRGKNSAASATSAAAQNKPGADRRETPPAAATIHDVATAIAAIGTGENGAGSPFADDPDLDLGDAREIDITLDAPDVDDDPKGWKQTVVRSINDTRNELKHAHSNVTRLRRTLTEIGRRRKQNRNQIASSLDRADTLLTEIRDAWR